MALALPSRPTRISKASPRRIARWSADRLRHSWKHLVWHARRLRFVAYERFPVHGALPPGSLSAGAAREASLDDRYYLEQHARHGTIFKLYWGSGDLKICMVGFPLARRVFSAHGDSLRPVPIDITSLVPAEYLRAMSPALHPRYRSLFVGALRNDLIAGWEPAIRALIRRELDALTRPHPGVTAARALEHALDRIATQLLLGIVLGVRPGSAESDPLLDGFRRLGPDGYTAQVGPAQKTAFHDIRAIVVAILDRLSDPGGNAPCGDSVIARLAVHGDASASSVDDTVIGNCIYMIERGRHDFRDLMRWTIKMLTDNPSAIADLSALVATPPAFSRLAEACVLETVRLEQAELLVRRAHKAITVEGYHVPKGSLVCALMRETHRDPKVFDAPDTFRPARFLERKYSSDEYAPFGIDHHQCIGRALNLRAGTILVEELVSGYTWVKTGDGPRVFGKYHWQPSAEFAIDLRRRA